MRVLVSADDGPETLFPTYHPTARWIPKSANCKSPDCPHETLCVCKAADTEYIYPYDLNNDGFSDLIVVEEEIRRRSRRLAGRSG